MLGASVWFWLSPGSEKQSSVACTHVQGSKIMESLPLASEHHFVTGAVGAAQCPMVHTTVSPRTLSAESWEMSSHYTLTATVLTSFDISAMILRLSVFHFTVYCRWFSIPAYSLTIQKRKMGPVSCYIINVLICVFPDPSSPASSCLLSLL